MLTCPKAKSPLAEPESGPAQTSEAAGEPSAAWAKPALNCYGDIRQLTMGISPGILESGGSTERHD